MFYEVENEGNLIAAPRGCDSIRKHLAECGYHTAEIREKYYLRRTDVYIDIRILLRDWFEKSRRSK